MNRLPVFLDIPFRKQPVNEEVGIVVPYIPYCRSVEPDAGDGVQTAQTDCQAVAFADSVRGIEFYTGVALPFGSATPIYLFAEMQSFP